MPLFYAESKKVVHIRISDTEWILEKLAREIAQRLPYVSFDMYANGEAEIQYYITYGCRQQRASPIEVALFTHKEQTPEAADKFDQVAREVDFCIAQSLATEQIIRGNGIERVQTIYPGVELNLFKPLVRIGVIGKTYHTGRKGGALVAAVMDIPGIEWHFTGPGWPGPSRFIADDELPSFYQSLDYVLVPAMIEGGPMCVLEALACGCKVIASTVGWVPQFPHIEFKLGDAADLHRVLLEVLEEKAALRRSVEAYTWDAFAQQHHELFKQLLGRDPLLDDAGQNILLSATKSGKGEGRPLRAIIAVHGNEMSGSQGGPSVRAPRTAAVLRRIGVAAEFVSNRKFSAQDADVVHVLNVWQPDECEVLLRQIEKNNRPAVLSPIFLDLSELFFFNTRVREILTQSTSEDEVRSALSVMCEDIAKHHCAPLNQREPIPGYFSAVRRLTTFANHLILLSEHERNLLADIGVSHASISIVKNPVEAAVFQNGAPVLFQEKFGVSKYVLCVGRIESRKNQALLAFALRNTGIPVVFVGHSQDTAYVELVKKWGGTNVVFAGRLEPHSEMLASALAGAQVFCLPSWSEGAPLVALEAAAAGCNMVLSDRSSEQEYFGDLARYVNPADPDDIRSKVLAAYNDNVNTRANQSQRLKELIINEHSWEHYATQTRDAYLTAQSRKKAQHPIVAGATLSGRRIFIDLTTMAHHSGPSTDITRTEGRLTHELQHCAGTQLRYIIWNSTHQKFVEIQKMHIENGSIKTLQREAGAVIFTHEQDRTPFVEIDFQEGDQVVIFGDAWIRNTAYLRDLWALKCALGITLVTTVYDVIQYKMHSLLPPGIGAEFGSNCSSLLEISDFVLTCSKQCLNDIVDFCLTHKIATPPIEVFRLGDEAISIDPSAKFQTETIEHLKSNQRFVLYVSSIDARKNHRLLLELWRRLINEHGEAVPLLVLVGRTGWRGEETIELLKTDTLLKNKLVLLHDINDRTLDWLYQNCLFTVYPSLYEGLGLPVSESLMHGKLCISSDGGSLPEVAPGFAEYITPLDFIGWYRALVKYCFTPSLLEERSQYIRDNYKPTEWKTTANQVMSALNLIPLTRQRLAPITIGNVIKFSGEVSKEKLASDSFKLSGWGRGEKAGCWTNGTRAILGFQLDQRPTRSLALRVEANGYAPDEVPVQVIVVANGTMLTRWSVGSQQSNLQALIPASLVEEDCALRVELLIQNPRSPSHYQKSTDNRLLGLNVRAASLRNDVTPLILDSWYTIDEIGSIEHIISGPTSDPRAAYLGIEIETNEPASFDIEINGKIVDTCISIPGEQFAKTLRHGLDIFGRTDPFIVKLLTKGTANHRSLQLGLFTKPPYAVLLHSLRKHALDLTHCNMNEGHVHHVGSTPVAVLGEFAKAEGLSMGLVGGWHGIEPNGVWTNGSPASIYLKPAETSGPEFLVSLEFYIYPWLLEARADFDVKIGKFPILPLLGNMVVDSNYSLMKRDFKVSTADALDAEGRLAITLHTNGAIAPADIGESLDSRSLAIKFVGLSIQSIVPIELMKG